MPKTGCLDTPGLVGIGGFPHVATGLGGLVGLDGGGTDGFLTGNPGGGPDGRELLVGGGGLGGGGPLDPLLVKPPLPVPKVRNLQHKIDDSINYTHQLLYCLHTYIHTYMSTYTYIRNYIIHRDTHTYIPIYAHILPCSPITSKYVHINTHVRTYPQL